MKTRSGFVSNSSSSSFLVVWKDNDPPKSFEQLCEQLFEPDVDLNKEVAGGIPLKEVVEYLLSFIHYEEQDGGEDELNRNSYRGLIRHRYLEGSLDEARFISQGMKDLVPEVENNHEIAAHLISRRYSKRIRYYSFSDDNSPWSYLENSSFFWNKIPCISVSHH